MKKTIIIIITIGLLLIAGSANSAFTPEMEEGFGGKTDATALVKYFTLWDTQFFGGKTLLNWANTQSNITGEHPSNQSIDHNLSIAVGCTVNDANSNHTMNVTYASNHSESWVNYQTNSSITSGQGTNWTFSSASSWDTKYYWKVYVHDGFSNVSETFWFTTKINPDLAFTLFDTLTFGGKTEVENKTIIPDVHPDYWGGNNPNVGTQIQFNFTYYQNGSETVDVKIGFNETNYTFVNYATWFGNGHDQYCANFTIDSWSSETNIAPKEGGLAVTVLNTGVTSSFSFGVRIWIPKTVSFASLREDFKIMFTSTAS